MELLYWTSISLVISGIRRRSLWSSLIAFTYNFLDSMLFIFLLLDSMNPIHCVKSRVYKHIHKNLTTVHLILNRLNFPLWYKSRSVFEKRERKKPKALGLPNIVWWATLHSNPRLQLSHATFTPLLGTFCVWMSRNRRLYSQQRGGCSKTDLWRSDFP